MSWEFGVRRCRLVYTECVNKILQYSTENYIQYSVINHNGKECEKEYIYVCVCVREREREIYIHYAEHQKLTHYKSTILQ